MPLKCNNKVKDDELLLVIKGEGDLNLTDIDNFCIFFEKYLHGNTPFKLLVDLRAETSASLKLIKKFASKMIEYENHSIDKVLITVIMIDNMLVKNLLKLLFSIKKPITPTEIVSSVEDCCKFLNKY